MDICVEVSMMSFHVDFTRQGHLNQVFQIFGNLRKHKNAEMVFDPTEPDIKRSQFEKQDWSHTIYCELNEAIPTNAPLACGRGMRMTIWVDSDHAGELITRRSRTGYLIFLNGSTIYWFSKKITSIETSTFGYELCAMKQATEYVCGIRYKLIIMGLPRDEPNYVYGENQYILANTSAPEYQYNNKSNSTAYHFVCEGVARDEWRTTYVNMHENTSDLVTRYFPSGDKRWKFVRRLLCWIRAKK